VTDRAVHRHLPRGAAIVASPAPASVQSKPTVVLVHGAFADASGWSKVTARLQRRGYPVIAPPTRCAASAATPHT